MSFIDCPRCGRTDYPTLGLTRGLDCCTDCYANTNTTSEDIHSVDESFLNVYGKKTTEIILDRLIPILTKKLVLQNAIHRRELWESKPKIIKLLSSPFL